MDLADAGPTDSSSTVDAGALDTGFQNDVGSLSASIHPLCKEDSSLVQPLGASDEAFRAAGLSKAIEVPLPGAGSIRFLAQDGVSNAQLLRSRRIFLFYLEEVMGARYGEDKRRVIEAVANNQATLVYFNSQADSERAQNGALQGISGVLQDLYATESPVEGSPAYLDSSTRDASYEELFHLLHGAGIQPALPDFQKQIEAATQAALQNRVWTPEAEQLAEWRAEGSESFEYIISVIDVYYGLWAYAPPPYFHGEYQLSTRQSLKDGDSLGLAAVEGFLPNYLGHFVELAPSFEGTFKTTLDPQLKYTLKSRYLRDVGLSGTKNANLEGNQRDNLLRGNLGNNFIDGGPGSDRVIYCRPRAEYSLNHQGGEVRVSGPDGEDVLRNVEFVHFADEILAL